MRCQFPALTLAGDFARIKLQNLALDPETETFADLFAAPSFDKTLDNNHWRDVGDSKGRKGRLSWDREDREADLLSSDQSSSVGTDFYKGVGFRRPYSLKSCLTLNLTDYLDFQAMYELQQSNSNLEALLYDHRLALIERSPRTRGQFDDTHVFTYTPTGMDIFWAIYRVRILEPKIMDYQINSDGIERFSIDLTLNERIPPLSTSFDGDP